MTGKEQGQLVDTQGDFFTQAGDLSRQQGLLGFSLGNLQLGGKPQAKTALYRRHGRLLGGKIFFGHGKTLLTAAPFHIIAADLGFQADQYRPTVFRGGFEGGSGGLDAATFTAKDINLPVRIKTGLEKILLKGCRRTAGIAAARMAGGGAAINGRGGSGGDHPVATPCRLDPTGGNLQVLIGGKGLIDQFRQERIFEQPPPTGLRHARLGLGRWPAPLGRQICRGRYIVGPNRRAGGKQENPDY